jgi:predicted alpha/beta-fold hydrolase
MTFTHPVPAFEPHPLLFNGHLMTIAPALLKRKLDQNFPRGAERRLFQVSADTHLLGHCHWQADRKAHPTMIVLHGLEGSSESSHVMALAQKAFGAGMNAIRLNLRNCGGSMNLTPTLYNAGLSADLIAAASELRDEGLPQLMAVGFSLGGNITLKAMGELGMRGETLFAAAAAISPSIDLELSVAAIEQPRNRIYEMWFLRTLKEKIKLKQHVFPDRYDLAKLAGVHTLRGFDDTFTAPDGGYGRAANYYHQASALRVIEHIAAPTLIITAKDDPMLPFSMFEQPPLRNPNVTLISTEFGGHAGFVQRAPEDSPALDLFWAENRVIDFGHDILAQ